MTQPAFRNPQANPKEKLMSTTQSPPNAARPQAGNDKPVHPPASPFGALTGVLFVFMAAALLYLLIANHGQNTAKAEAEKNLREYFAGIHPDTFRTTSIMLIRKIISRHNKNMPSAMRYDIADEIYKMSLKYTNLDVALISAVITHESAGTWEPEIVSEAGAMGLMQVMPSTGLWLAHYEGITWNSPSEVLFNPLYNIRLGCRQLSTYIEKYGLEGGLAAYNGGEKRAAIWLKHKKGAGILWAETDNYIPQVLRLYEKYKSITL